MGRMLLWKRMTEEEKLNLHHEVVGWLRRNPEPVLSDYGGEPKPRSVEPSGNLANDIQLAFAAKLEWLERRPEAYVAAIEAWHDARYLCIDALNTNYDTFQKARWYSPLEEEMVKHGLPRGVYRVFLNGFESLDALCALTRDELLKRTGGQRSTRTIEAVLGRMGRELAKPATETAVTVEVLLKRWRRVSKAKRSWACASLRDVAARIKNNSEAAALAAAAQLLEALA